MKSHFAASQEDRPSMEDLPTDYSVFPGNTFQGEAERFTNIWIKQHQRTKIIQAGVEVVGGNSFNLKLRMTPLEEVRELSQNLAEEDFCVAGPVIDVEDAKEFLDHCEEIKLRHNVKNWKTSRFELRLYKSTTSSSYKRIDACMTAEHITGQFFTFLPKMCIFTLLCVEIIIFVNFYTFECKS